MTQGLDITLEDIHAFNRHYARNAPLAIRARRAARFGLTFMLTVVFGALGAGFHMPLAYWLLGAMILLGFWAMFPARLEQIMRRRTEQMYAEGRNRGLLGPHQIAIEPDALVEKSELREVRTNWKAIERVETTR